MSDTNILQPVRQEPLDYVNSDNAAEIDNGIRETIKGIRLSILAMGIGLAKIKSKGLFRDLSCRNMTEYLERLGNETKMDRSNIFNWLYIGETYIKYKSELDTIGFSESDGPTKLPYLERALDQKEKQEVLEKIKTLSVREFMIYAKGEPGEPEKEAPYVSIRGNNIYVEGKLAIILSKNIDKRISRYFKKVIHVACKALEEGEVILPVRLQNRREARRFEPIVERMIQKMRERGANSL